MSYVIMSAGLATAQTNVSGGIYTNTTWTKVNSPYIVTGDIVVFPGKTLTIEPGVEVKVKMDSLYSIEIRGTLVAIGTITDSISFISNDSLSPEAWDGINILNATHNAVGSFKYCIVKHSSFGIGFECCGVSNQSIINNSLFDNNYRASSCYGGFPIDLCVFANNTIAIEGSPVITNSAFLNNDIGVKSESFEVRNCFFQNNGIAIDQRLGGAVIDSCTIINNNIGLKMDNGIITNNNISNNVIGLITRHTSSTQNGTEYYVPIKNNRICNNTQYNIKNNNSYNKNITGNCFCTTDSAAIESKLFDGYDSISKGLFNYDIYDSTCQNITQSVYKVGTNPLSSNTVISKEPNFTMSPNPFSDFIFIQFNNQSPQLYSVIIYNMLGQTIQQFENINPVKKTIDCGNIKSGIYLIQLIQNGSIIEQQKLIKQ